MNNQINEKAPEGGGPNDNNIEINESSSSNKFTTFSYFKNRKKRHSTSNSVHQSKNTIDSNQSQSTNIISLEVNNVMVNQQLTNSNDEGIELHHLESKDSDMSEVNDKEQANEISNEISNETSDGVLNENIPENSIPILPPPYSAFPSWRKKLIIGLVTLAGFLGPLSGSIYLPILQVIEREFSISTSAANATVSVFMAVFAVAPLFWASWADFGGRKFLYLISISIYIIASLLLATVPRNVAALFILRVVQAFGAASVQSLGAGTVADIIEPKNRGQAISIFMLGPQLGPVLGPILGGAIGSNGQWRWIFGFLSKSPQNKN